MAETLLKIFLLPLWISGLFVLVEVVFIVMFIRSVWRWWLRPVKWSLIRFRWPVYYSQNKEDLVREWGKIRRKEDEYLGKKADAAMKRFEKSGKPAIPLEETRKKLGL